MKFTDGYWQMRDGVTPHYAAQVYETEAEKDSLTVYAPTKKLSGRGDTINLPILTVRFSSPMENVIHIQMRHHKGAQSRKPEFTTYEEPNVQVAITDTDQIAILTSGELSARVTKGD